MVQRPGARPGARAAHQRATDPTEILPVYAPDIIAAAPAVARTPFAKDLAVLRAPELDDTNDLIEQWPLLLLGPRPDAVTRQRSAREEFRRSAPEHPRPAARTTRRTPPARQHRPTSHRKTPAAVGPVRSRLIIAGVAAGAVAAAANAATNAAQPGPDSTPTLASAGPSVAASGIQIVPVINAAESAIHTEEVTRGAAFARERAAREAALRRPQFVYPTNGILTSAFGTRWGTLHAGLDIANAVGTPVYAAADGVVIASGPTPGYGMWVKIRGADGTVTLYGHIDTTTVEVGDRVIAGDQVATMGNRGNSTGPHLHFEVHANGSQKIDPATWLRVRGVTVG
ncbi:peptidase M23 [Mycobacterium adipatum]|uniref:Peptidase M23 n=1 Tax=Mycobacterium adipatum TaxID=1682113 RepID=A0A172UHP0_9MYCO|nr:peptidase M23 [Mycobacterium adipatum]